MDGQYDIASRVTMVHTGLGRISLSQAYALLSTASTTTPEPEDCDLSHLMRITFAYVVVMYFGSHEWLL